MCIIHSALESAYDPVYSWVPETLDNCTYMTHMCACVSTLAWVELMWPCKPYAQVYVCTCASGSVSGCQCVGVTVYAVLVSAPTYMGMGVV